MPVRWCALSIATRVHLAVQPTFRFRLVMASMAGSLGKGISSPVGTVRLAGKRWIICVQADAVNCVDWFTVPLFFSFPLLWIACRFISWIIWRIVDAGKGLESPLTVGQNRPGVGIEGQLTGPLRHIRLEIWVRVPGHCEGPYINRSWETRWENDSMNPSR